MDFDVRIGMLVWENDMDLHQNPKQLILERYNVGLTVNCPLLISLMYIPVYAL